MSEGDTCLQGPGLDINVPVPSTVEGAGYIKRKCSISPRGVSDGISIEQGKALFILPRHIRLARACYAVATNSFIEEHVTNKSDSCAGNKRARSSQSDFWSRVDSGEIKIQTTLDEWRNSAKSTLQRKVNTNIPNFAISTTNLSDYSYKTTAFGDVYYSPRFNDNKYTYRFVILTKGVRNEAYRILKSCGRHFLTEVQIIHQLGIDLSPGWEHFMVFRNKLEELILRRPLGS
ncbi:uncharacterized protein BXIN_2128 [Babesia sp. Xinjiang]|uniref:uncharacterized protein n=1 Tax=Babesia sp. Xinjiang TaxID=462227 RepID=UPI000A216A9D|nr:uncharacterized protein BXIN_2128 [Babesia sp. Xinjiang]ORM40555.1 hypothetical protein BXIN_2128 [Babesia sp. Xinjiang]